MSRSAARDKIGVLLVTGGQTHQENYARAFAADKRCKLIALTDEPSLSRRRRELNERLARELDIPYIESIDEALKRPDVHVVSICAEPERRAAIAVKCARAKKHLYLDKSLAPTLADADAIVAAAAEAQVRSHMFSFITQPWARRAKEMLRDNRLGDLIAVHADTHFAKGMAGSAKLGPRREQASPDPATFQKIEAKREMDNVAVYGISLIRWLTDREFRSVHCVTANYFFQEHQRHDAEDFATLALIMDGDLPVTISAGRIGWTSHPAGGTNRVVLVASDRTAVVEANRPRIEVYNNDKPWVPPPVNPADPMGFWLSTQQEVHTAQKWNWQSFESAASDASYFIDCIESNRDSEMTAADAAAATEVLLAGYKSAALGEVVPLPLLRS